MSEREEDFLIEASNHHHQSKKVKNQLLMKRLRMIQMISAKKSMKKIS
jgi:hypothetical protein